MNRSQFEQAVRAAAAVVGEHEVIVIGSQAVHASLEGEIRETAMRSVGADVAIPGERHQVQRHCCTWL